jgi:hypothetical protein
MTTLGLPPFSSLDDLRSSLKMPQVMRGGGQGWVAEAVSWVLAGMPGWVPHILPCKHTLATVCLCSFCN